LRAKEPSGVVEVPAVLPFNTTEMPETGCPFSEDKTLPRKVVCETTDCINSPMKNGRSSNLIELPMYLYLFLSHAKLCRVYYVNMKDWSS